MKHFQNPYLKSQPSPTKRITTVCIIAAGLPSLGVVIGWMVSVGTLPAKVESFQIEQQVHNQEVDRRLSRIEMNLVPPVGVYWTNNLIYAVSK